MAIKIKEKYYNPDDLANILTYGDGLCFFCENNKLCRDIKECMEEEAECKPLPDLSNCCEGTKKFFENIEKGGYIGDEKTVCGYDARSAILMAQLLMRHNITPREAKDYREAFSKGYEMAWAEVHRAWEEQFKGWMK